MIVACDDCRPLLPLLVLQLVIETRYRQIFVNAVIGRWLDRAVWRLLIEVLLRLERLLAAASLVRLP